MTQASQLNQRAGEFLTGNILRAAALRFGEREALFCSETGRRFTYRELNSRCNRIANGLAGLGLGKGDVVAVLSRNRAELVETLFAIAKSGMIGLPLNYRLAEAEMLQLMASVNARAIVCDGDFAALALRAPGLAQRVVFGQAEAAPGLARYEDLLASAPDTEPDVDVREHDTYYFNLTSGTSGLPKCYALTHYACVSSWPMFHAMELGTRDVIMTAFPMFGRVGFLWCVAGLMYGARNVILDFDEASAARLIEQERVTITNLVPTMGAMLLQGESLARHDMSSLRSVVFAGSQLPAPIREGVIARMCPSIHEYYGMQETATLVLSTPEDRAIRPDSVGRAILHSDVRVVGEDGRALPPGQVGEIVGRTPASASGYHDNPAKTAETFRNGWIHTGDLGAFDEEGYLFIRGRKKDVIVTGGQNVFAAEVEEAILVCESVRECAVIGLPDDLWGERVSAVVVLRDGAQESAESIVRHCRQHLPGFKTPKQVILMADPLPRTPTGKVQKFVLVEQYGKAA